DGSSKKAGIPRTGRRLEKDHRGGKSQERSGRLDQSLGNGLAMDRMGRKSSLVAVTWCSCIPADRAQLADWVSRPHLGHAGREETSVGDCGAGMSLSSRANHAGSKAVVAGCN